MENLTLLEPFEVAPDVTVLPSYIELPGLGMLPINAFLIRGAEPVLIDTGSTPLAAEFMTVLATLIDPNDLRYIWLTHIDPDHVGALDRLVEAAPDAQLVTTFLGRGKLELQGRAIRGCSFVVLEPGQRLALADRSLVALRPPTFDAPETIAALDTETHTLFVADTFGALLDRPTRDLAEIPPARLRAGMITWSSFDVPWLALTDTRRFEAVLQGFANLAPETILGSHVPPAYAMTRELLDHLAAVRAQFVHGGEAIQPTASPPPPTMHA